jgi:hypothetical protein
MLPHGRRLRPVAVLGGLPDAAPWTALAGDGETATFYAGGAEIELYRSEADNYRRNLASAAPAVWVALQETGGDPPYAVAAVTADPAEGEGLTEPGQGIIEAVAMPEPLRQNLGGAIGLATIVTIMNERLHFHWNRLIEDINPARASVQQFLDLQVNRFDPLIPGDPNHAAVKMLADLVRREALVLTYNDLLLLIGSLFIFALMLIPLVGRPRSFLSH